ncbi:MAG: leucine-rich repeat protein [Oscillospiraceae bacterium]|nr:leucine-rich repeat protein [Oscillospiraceae bacterium]
MKKTIIFLIVTVLLGCSAPDILLSVSALETATIEEYNQQMKLLNEEKFPDSDAKYSEVTENDFVFHLYENYAFLTEYKNTEITEITIPDEIQGLPVLGCTGSPFGYCHKLTTIQIPDNFHYFKWHELTSTTFVKAGSTEDPMPSVSKVIVSDTNPYYTVSDDMLYTKDMKMLIGCPPALDRKELHIAEQTETVGDYAFFACMSLEKAVIPSHVMHINNNAFTACLNLVSAELPESITSVSGDMFYYCQSLTDVTFRGQIQTIGYGAFAECSALTDFLIPDTVTYIGRNAFQNSGCIENLDGVHYVQNWVVGSDEDIKRAVIREGTAGISELAFFLRNQAELLDIPESIKYIGNLCFVGGINGVPSVIHYRNAVINEKTLISTKATTDIYIYHPDCDIFDSEKTIPANYKYAVPEKAHFITDYPEEERYNTGDVVIHGYAGSTAQAYAEKYHRQFAVIEENSLSGDANGDGTLDVSDIVLLHKWLQGIPDTHLADWKASDLTKDGKINIFDFIRLKYLLLETN